MPGLKTRVHPTLGLCLVSLLATACQQGGSTTNATSEVKIAVDQHMSSLGGLVRFKEGFPINANASYTDAATLHFLDDGNYSLSRPGQKTSNPEKYLLGKSGKLTILVSQRNRSALRWLGFLDLTGDAFFFTSREPGFLRLFVGVRQLSGKPTLEGGWHVFGDTLVFAKKTDKPSPDRVGRAFAGSLTLDKAGKVTAGTWKDSTGSTVLVAGTLKASSLGFTDAALDLKGGPATGARSFSGGVAKHLGVLIDRVSTDGNVGLLMLVREQTAALDPKRVTGDWRVGLHAIFHRPGQSGVDVTPATLTLDTDATWKLKLDAGGTTLEGTWKIENKGALTLTEKGFNQPWLAAIDPDYRSIVITDLTSEKASNPWVGVMLGIRE